VSQGKGSVLDWLKDKGLVNTTDFALMKRQADQIMTAERARAGATGRAVDMAARVPDLYDAGARVVGANLGGMAGRGTGAPLVTAGIGSRLVRGRLEALGGPSQGRVLEKAMLGQDGRSLQQLLEAYQARQGVTVNAAGQPITPLPFLLRPGAQSAAVQGRLKRDSPERRSAY
jgi:hypothetical protein